LDHTHLAAAQAKTAELNKDGFRVVAVAYKEIPERKVIPSRMKAT
jgi:Mg2+-importing ATPase